MRSYPNWQWWAFVAVAFFYGLSVMVAVMIFVRRSKLRQEDAERRSAEFDNERESGETMNDERGTMKVELRIHHL